MESNDDWRLVGDWSSIFGETFYWSSWLAPRPEWDHDHCLFCWVHFCDGVLEDDPDTQLAGYTVDGQDWICTACFDDFHERFQWITVHGPPQMRWSR